MDGWSVGQQPAGRLVGLLANWQVCWLICASASLLANRLSRVLLAVVDVCVAARLRAKPAHRRRHACGLLNRTLVPPLCPSGPAQPANRLVQPSTKQAGFPSTCYPPPRRAPPRSLRHGAPNPNKRGLAQPSRAETRRFEPSQLLKPRRAKSSQAKEKACHAKPSHAKRNGGRPTNSHHPDPKQPRQHEARKGKRPRPSCTEPSREQGRHPASVL